MKSGQGVLGADASAIMQHLATQKEDLAAHKEQLAQLLAEQTQLGAKIDFQAPSIHHLVR